MPASIFSHSTQFLNIALSFILLDLPNGASAQYTGKPIVSTFSGDTFTSWPAVRALVPAFELIPFVQAANIAAVGADG